MMRFFRRYFLGDYGVERKGTQRAGCLFFLGLPLGRMEDSMPSFLQSLFSNGLSRKVALVICTLAGPRVRFLNVAG